eukprot:m.823735 g.823735  ORF g.823735 m.823735 type:complete len:118 (+) comp23403_c0_seq10:1817-2170(+)
MVPCRAFLKRHHRRKTNVAARNHVTTIAPLTKVTNTRNRRGSVTNEETWNALARPSGDVAHPQNFNIMPLHRCPQRHHETNEHCCPIQTQARVHTKAALCFVTASCTDCTIFAKVPV